MAWLILTIHNQKVNNGLKAKKIKFPQMNFFPKKQLIKFWCTYWLLSFCKIFKKCLRANPEFWGCAIFGPKMAHLSWTKFFWYKPLLLLLLSTYWPFLQCKILKNSYSGSKVMRMRHFWGHIYPKENYFWKIIKIILIFLLAPLKKSFQQIQSYEDAQFLGPKWSISPNENFFQKTC